MLEILNGLRGFIYIFIFFILMSPLKKLMILGVLKGNKKKHKGIRWVILRINIVCSAQNDLKKCIWHHVLQENDLYSNH